MKISIAAGDATEALLQSLLTSCDDSTIDQIEVDREIEPSPGLACEAETIVATLSAATPIMLLLVRLAERWIEKNRQIDTIKLVAEGFSQSDEVGKHLSRLAEKHASISVSYKLVGPKD